MLDQTPRDRLLPSLLDRLTDEEPKRKEETRERRSINMRDLRDAVLRDLEFLFNTTNYECGFRDELNPVVRDSVINYGLPALSGNIFSSSDLTRIQQEIKHCVQVFEPRILKDTVKVKIVHDDSASRRSLIFQIEGTLWGNPMPEALFLRTELDLELGAVKVSEH